MNGEEKRRKSDRCWKRMKGFLCVCLLRKRETAESGFGSEFSNLKHGTYESHRVNEP